MWKSVRPAAKRKGRDEFPNTVTQLLPGKPPSSPPLLDRLSFFFFFRREHGTPLLPTMTGEAVLCKVGSISICHSGPRARDATRPRTLADVAM